MNIFEGDTFGSLDAFRLTAREVPEPSRGQVRIRIYATALGFVDSLLIEGRYQIKPPLPYIPGGEIAGVVDSVGAGVVNLSAGARVVTWQLGGGLAEYVVVAAADVDPMPPALGFIEAAAMLVDYQTAYYALFERGQLRAGETVLVAGAAGGVGSATVQLAAQAGAYVLAVTSTPEKRDRARKLGAQATIDALSEDLRTEIRAAAPHGVVDVVVDPVGGPTFEMLFRSLGKEGRHLIVGFAGGSIPALPANLPLLKSAALVGVDVRQFLSAKPDAARAARTKLFDQVAARMLAPPQAMNFALEQAGEALAATRQRDKLGKVVVVQQTSVNN
jgi:NADPH:quinone reductase